MDLGIKSITLRFDDNQLGYLQPVQGDTRSRGFLVEMVSTDGEVLEASTGYECRLYGVNSNYPDKTFYTVATIEDGRYKVYLSTDMVSKAGSLKLQIALYKGSEELIQSEVKEVEVTESMANGGSIGKDLVVDFTKLEKALERVDAQEKAYKDSLQKQEVIKADIDKKQSQVSTDTTAVKNIRQDMEGVMAAEASRVSAEKTRQSQESTRQAQETTRKNQESTRQSQEITRKNQETQRVEAEKKRVSAENVRASAESTRSSQESTRQSEENKRVSQENTRLSQEKTRVSQETTRQSQETQRVEAEKKRKSIFEGWDKTMQGVIPNATEDTAGVVKVAGLGDEEVPYTVHSVGVMNKEMNYILDEANKKAEKTHKHTIEDVTNLQTELDKKAEKVHKHTIEDVNNLQTELNKKQPTLSAGSNITISGNTISAKDTVYDDTSVKKLIGGKANENHTHAISDVSNLQTALNGKASSSHTHAGMVTGVGSFKVEKIAVISSGGSTSGVPNNTLIFELE